MEITVSRLRRIMDLTRGAIGQGTALFVLGKDGLAVSNNLDLAIAVEILWEQSRVTLKTVDSKFSPTLHTSVVEEFPDFPVFERTGGGEVDEDDLVSNITELLAYASKEKARPVLAGVCPTLGEALEVAAADGFRLA